MQELKNIRIAEYKNWSIQELKNVRNEQLKKHNFLNSRIKLKIKNWWI